MVSESESELSEWLGEEDDVDDEGESASGWDDGDVGVIVRDAGMLAGREGKRKDMLFCLFDFVFFY